MIRKRTLLCLCLYLLLLTGCVNDECIATYIEEYFQTNDGVIYNEPMVGMDPDYMFSFAMSQDVFWDITEVNGYGRRDIFTVFTDVDLTKRIPVDTIFQSDTLLIAPSFDSRYFVEGNAERVFTTEPSQNEDETQFSAWNDWGYFSHYYLVQNFDLVTGERLQIPIVTVFTIDRALQNPKLTVTHEEDNSFTLSWDGVRDASVYYLVRVDFFGRLNYEVNVIATTTNTYWNSEVDAQQIDNANVEIFSQYLVSRDQQFASEMKLWWNDVNALSPGSIFGVVARGDDGLSNLSFFHDNKIKPDGFICEAAPFAMNEVVPDLEIETIVQIPAFLPVTVCSGATINGEIILDVDYAWWQDDILHVPFVFNHSNLRDYFTIVTADITSYQEELIARQSQMTELFAQNDRLDYRYQSTRAVAFDVRSSNSLPEIDDTIFSTSELETFIAANMIDGAAIIDISQFYEEDRSFLAIVDSLNQTLYQNPLILQHHGVFYDYENKVIFVHYLYDPQTRAKIQQTIRDEVSRIANEIITPDMSDVEKVFAINQFIIDNTVYDDDAYESLRDLENFFLEEDFLHTSTAGGVFIQGYAICEGFSAAFMILADYVGIESIAVTGYTVDDAGRHMWNRVLIGEQWYIVDVTHNDDDLVPNSVLLLADDIADQIYVEDRFFLIDSKLAYHRAPIPSVHEYYYLQGLFANDISEGTDLVVNQLQAGDFAMVRLPIDVTNEQLDEIAQVVANRFQRAVVYYHFNGVMHVVLQ